MTLNSIFVKNLPTYSQQNRLRSIFSQFGPIESVGIYLSKKKPQNNSSFACIKFYSKRSQKRALAAKFLYYNGHRVRVEPFNKKSQENLKAVLRPLNKKNSTKQRTKYDAEFVEQKNIQKGRRTAGMNYCQQADPSGSFFFQDENYLEEKSGTKVFSGDFLENEGVLNPYETLDGERIHHGGMDQRNPDSGSFLDEDDRIEQEKIAQKKYFKSRMKKNRQILSVTRRIPELNHQCCNLSFVSITEWKSKEARGRLIRHNCHCHGRLETRNFF